MTYDELVRHLTYEDVYCDNIATPHKCALLHSKPMGFSAGHITCDGPCAKKVKSEDGFFYCKQCNWVLCLDCLAAYHPNMVNKRCIKPQKDGHTCPLNCGLKQKLSKSDLINHLIKSCEEMLVKCDECKASWKRGHIPKMKHDRAQCIM